MLKKHQIKDILTEKFSKDRESMYSIIEEHHQEHKNELESVKDTKEKNLNFISNENDEYESKILKLK